MTVALDIRDMPQQCPPRTDNGEAVFCDWLQSQGYTIAYEPVTLPFPPLPRRGGQAIMPDVRILWLPDGRKPPWLFLELTEADRYPERRQLPKHVRDKNRRHSASGKDWLPVPAYITRKQRKIAAAELYHHHRGVIIELLNWADQQAIMAHPDLLTERINARLAQVAPALTVV